MMKPVYTVLWLCLSYGYEALSYGYEASTSEKNNKLSSAVYYFTYFYYTRTRTQSKIHSTRDVAVPNCLFCVKREDPLIKMGNG